MSTYTTPIKPFQVKAGMFDELLAKGNPGYGKLVHVYYQKQSSMNVKYHEMECILLDKRGMVISAHEYTQEEFAEQPYEQTMNPRKLDLVNLIRRSLNLATQIDQVWQIKVVLDGFGEVIINAEEVEMA